MHSDILGEKNIHQFKKSHYDLFRVEMKKIGIELRVGFFNKLDDALLKLENPPNYEESKSLYVCIFRKENDPSEHEVRNFINGYVRIFGQSEIVDETKQALPGAR